MEINDNKKKVLAVLLAVDHKPLTSRKISQLTGLTDIQVRGAVRELRERDHERICSGDLGFWLWDGEDDSWQHTKAQILSRINSLARLYQAMEYEPEDPQISMDL